MSTTGRNESEPDWAKSSSNKNVPYWVPNIDDKITPDCRALLENYSKVPAEDVKKHVYETREKAWAIRSYPCTGIGLWLECLLPRSPVYPEILQRLRAGATMMDVGCFLGTDLRRLVTDGVPSDKLIAVDVVNHWDVGYFFFRDSDQFKTRFVEADILHPAGNLAAFAGKMDVVSIILVFHQWNYETQREAAVNLAGLVRVGGLGCGFQCGTLPGTEPYSDPAGPPSYRHTPETWAGMWREVGEMTGTEWEVQAELWSMTATGWKEEDIRYLGKDCRLLQWVVRRKA